MAVCSGQGISFASEETDDRRIIIPNSVFGQVQMSRFGLSRDVRLGQHTSSVLGFLLIVFPPQRSLARERQMPAICGGIGKSDCIRSARSGDHGGTRYLGTPETCAAGSMSASRPHARTALLGRVCDDTSAFCRSIGPSSLCFLLPGGRVRGTCLPLPRCAVDGPSLRLSR